MKLAYPTDLTQSQLLLIEVTFGDELPKLRTNSSEQILNAIVYVLKGGIPWPMLPNDFPPHQTVYHHSMSFSHRGLWDRMLPILTQSIRGAQGKGVFSDTGVIDSQSSRSALPQSQKGIDGNKRIKGIKRHLIVDENGWPLDISVTAANVNDGVAACGLMKDKNTHFPELDFLKADLGYRGTFQQSAMQQASITVECVKSNFGTPEFIPIEGRWVVERTFSWLESFRRLTRNFEKLLTTARFVAMASCVVMMLRHFP